MPDIDRYREIADTLRRNKSRSLLTGFGVFWGVFMLVLLLGGGKGLQELLAANFEGFANNAAVIWAQPTSKPYQGFKKGRKWQMSLKDVDRLKQQVPGLDIVSPSVSQWGATAVYDRKKTTCALKGVRPDYALVETPHLSHGRYLNLPDMKLNRKVCVIGKKICSALFPGDPNPCGKYVRIDSIYYKVVGVDKGTSNIRISSSAEETIVIPLTLMQQAYHKGVAIDLISVTAKAGVPISTLSQPIRSVIARAHSVSPQDESALMIFNTETLYQMMDGLFEGVNLLVWLVGIGTLLAGAIGVSNIMLVTVRERTAEIGIRRAIGATPGNILRQIMAESVVLTCVAGMLGILFAIFILQMIQLGNTSDGVVAAHFQIPLTVALGALSIIVLLGGLAGLPPALKAIRIKPVDAMRNE